MFLLSLVGCGTEAVHELRSPQAVIEIELQCERVADRLRLELADRGAVVVRPPFVVAGDRGADELVVQYQQTIEPVVRAMQKTYFTTTPDSPITILLCSQTTSYRILARHLFADDPDSTWGYYKPGRRTIVVNLGRGTAGVGHELTHALMDFDFPTAPFWFREGLAALHESVQVRETETGLWLEGLQESRWKTMQSLLADDNLSALDVLLTRGKPRTGWAARRYAQARFFCLFLQRKQALRTYYQSFRQDCSSDPQGIRTLLKVLGRQELQEVERDFRRWLDELSIP